jgi:uncharacterized protein YjbI with pentapeptide repeats
LANAEHLKILEQGAIPWNEWRIRNDSVSPDLRDANLTDINLSGANLTSAFLSKAKFSRSYLVGTNFSGAFLDQTQFNEALLLGSNFGSSTIPRIENQTLGIKTLASFVTHGANLKEANFRGAYLGDVSFSTAYLSGTDFSDSMMRNSQFINVDLSKCKGLETVKHDGPSSIDIDTIYRSEGNIPEVFLQGTGVPIPFIAQMKSLVASMSPIQFYSCFISYSSRDQEFAERLHADLQSKGVRCWFAPEDLKIGDRLRPAFDEAIRVHDKLMVLLSDNSVGSPWVEKEVETAFEKEHRQNRTVLFPIRLDEAVMNTDQAWAADIRRTRHIGDFRGWKNHDSYKRAFDRLLRDLKAV